MAERPDLTALIQDWRQGDGNALEQLTPIVYEELRRLARRQISGEKPNHTLQATALVNEAFIRLVGVDVDYESRAHFFNTAAKVMRRVLVDHARAKHRQKRGGKARDLTLDEAAVVTPESLPAILELDMAMDKLADFDPKLALGVELLFFGGLSYDEAAKQLGVSRTAFYEDLKFAKAWLRTELS